MNDRPYFYRLRGRTLGPIGLQQIRQLAQRAQIGRSTDVSRDGIQWAKASDFPEIFVSVAAGAPSQASGSYGSPVSGAGGVMPVSPPLLASGPRWYYTVNGNQQGPIDLSMLQQLVAGGQVQPGDYAIPEGGSDWMTVASVPQLGRSGGFPGQGIPANPFDFNAGGRGGNVVCQSCGSSMNSHSVACPHCGAATGRGGARSGARRGKEKMTAALLALLLPCFGIHRFYLGDKMLGIAQLLTFGFCGIWGLIDFIVFLTMDQDAFDQKYNS